LLLTGTNADSVTLRRGKRKSVITPLPILCCLRSQAVLDEKVFNTLNRKNTLTTMIEIST